MSSGRPVRTVWILAGLFFGFAVVLAGPALLFWDFLHPNPWNETNLNAKFQFVRYESGGLVFRYTVRNLTSRDARFRPTLTEIRALQSKDQPAVGYPNVLLPFEVPANGSHSLDVRLELPSFRQLSSGMSFGEFGSPPSPAPASPSATGFSPQDALTDLEGFELVDETNGIRLVLPRAW
ncbi:MAG: hypothetical protein P4L56_05820 [Candidatus Sulfopaludibacter sp.]|nr:hypothetical protein [Candidatus Sulfopaludibacter sp.]